MPDLKGKNKIKCSFVERWKADISISTDVCLMCVLFTLCDVNVLATWIFCFILFCFILLCKRTLVNRVLSCWENGTCYRFFFFLRSETQFSNTSGRKLLSWDVSWQPSIFARTPVNEWFQSELVLPKKHYILCFALLLHQQNQCFDCFLPQEKIVNVRGGGGGGTAEAPWWRN